MNRQILTVVGIIFAVTFVALFIGIWGTSQRLIATSIDDINELYEAETTFDVSLFDGTLVSGKTINNLYNEIEDRKASYALSVTLKLKDNSGSESNYSLGAVNEDATYRSTLRTNDNESLAYIVFEEVDSPII